MKAVLLRCITVVVSLSMCEVRRVGLALVGLLTLVTMVTVPYSSAAPAHDLETSAHSRVRRQANCPIDKAGINCDTNCGPADIILVIDGSDETRASGAYDSLMAYAKAMVGRLPVGAGAAEDRVAAVVYSERGLPVHKWSDIQTAAAVQQSLDNALQTPPGSGPRNTAEGLHAANTIASDRRQNVDVVVLVLQVNSGENTTNIVKYADRLKPTTHVFVSGLNTDPVQKPLIADSDVKDFSVDASTEAELLASMEQMRTKMCQKIDQDDCTPDPCQNQGVCTDLGSYATCDCAKGFGGDKCENDCSKVDMVFIIDKSGSVTEPNWYKQIEFLVKVCSYYDIAPDKARVGAVSFSTDGLTEFGLLDYTTEADVVDRLRAIYYSGGYTHFSDAFNKTLIEVIQTTANRPDVPDVGITVFDGPGNRPTTTTALNFTIEYAKKLVDAGVATLSVPVGTRTSPTEQLAIAGGIEKHVIPAASFQTLEDPDFAKLVFEATCQMQSSLPCKSSPCKNGGTCRDTNMQKDYECLCTDEYTGTNCETKKKPCTLNNPCQNGATCINNADDTTSCQCAPGYIGQNCETDDPCYPPPCLNGGTCQPGGSCVCPSGFTGAVCETKLLCADITCQNGATCDPASGKCDCKVGYTGVYCETPLCPTGKCQNGGTCDPNTGKCTCMAGYSGEFCELTPCSPSPCKNGGVCSVAGSTFSCACQSPWTGTVCDENPCDPNPCKNGGVCSVAGSTFSCACQSPWTGTVCDENPCEPNPCQNGGVCKEGGACDCSTTNGFTGQLCDIPPPPRVCSKLDLCILLDSSISISDAHFAQLMTFAKTLIGGLPGLPQRDTQFGVVDFSTYVELSMALGQVTDSTTFNLDVDAGGIKHLKQSTLTGTALAFLKDNCITACRGDPVACRALVITDGMPMRWEIELSKDMAAEVRDMMEIKSGSKAGLFTLGIGTDIDYNLLLNYTNGDASKVFMVSNIDTLNNVANAILDGLCENPEGVSCYMCDPVVGQPSALFKDMYSMCDPDVEPEIVEAMWQPGAKSGCSSCFTTQKTLPDNTKYYVRGCTDDLANPPSTTGDECVTTTDGTICFCNTGLCNDGGMPEPCPDTDICFVIDTSASVNETEYTKIKGFTKEVIQKIRSSNPNVGFGAVLYGYKAELSFAVRTYIPTAEVLQAIDNLGRVSFTTRTDLAIKEAVNNCYSSSGLPKTLFVLTDGKSSNVGETQAQADLARGTHNMVCVGVDGADPDEIEYIAPGNWAYSNTFDDLGSIVDSILQKTCAIPPVPPSLCDPNPCQNGGVCSETATAYTCTCPDGFTGTNCETPVPPSLCDPNPCQNGGVCSETATAYTCTCPDGFTGTNCETPVPPSLCDPNPCQNGGVCSETATAYTCTCPDGFTGTNCETPVPPSLCDPNPCQNGGVCSETATAYTCTCPDGFTGTNCETPDPCVPQPCQNGGQCSPSGATFSCTCINGYTGTLCETDPCSGVDCGMGTCVANTVAPDYYICDCDRGYHGAACQIGPTTCVTCTSDDLQSQELFGVDWCSANAVDAEVLSFIIIMDQADYYDSTCTFCATTLDTSGVYHKGCADDLTPWAMSPELVIADSSAVCGYSPVNSEKSCLCYTSISIPDDKMNTCSAQTFANMGADVLISAADNLQSCTCQMSGLCTPNTCAHTGEALSPCDCPGGVCPSACTGG